MKIKKMSIPHIDALDRSIQAKQTALDSRHIPKDVKQHIQRDIDLLAEVKEFIYDALSHLEF